MRNSISILLIISFIYLFNEVRAHNVTIYVTDEMWLWLILIIVFLLAMCCGIWFLNKRILAQQQRMGLSLKPPNVSYTSNNLNTQNSLPNIVTMSTSLINDGYDPDFIEPPNYDFVMKNKLEKKY